MSQNLTLRVGDRYLIEVAASVDSRMVGTVRSVASSDDTKVSVQKIDDFRFMLTALAVTVSAITITATCGTKSDVVMVTVIQPTDVTVCTINLVGSA